VKSEQTLRWALAEKPRPSQLPKSKKSSRAGTSKRSTSRSIPFFLWFDFCRKILQNFSPAGAELRLTNEEIATIEGRNVREPELVKGT
jgi:hypothetical protein